MEALRPIAELWRQRTPRERTLALATAGLVLVFVVVLAIRGALGTLDRLNGTISRMQSDIVNYHYQIARREAVEARYREVAAQHSSAWSESEIRDRLRQEIYRLSYRKPPRLDANGIPVTTDSEGDQLVIIPELRGGRLEEGGEGFRAYQIEFDVPPAPFPDMLAYLEYLQDSPQSLRIDRIDLRRDPHRPEVTGRIQLSRIVVDDTLVNGEGAHESALLTADTIVLRPGDWSSTGCKASLESPAGATVLVLNGGENGGRAWLPRALPRGSTYDMQLEVSSGAEVQMGIEFQDEKMPAPGKATVAGDHQFYRCRLQFTVPNDTGERVTTAAPFLTWTAPNNTVRIRNLRITPIEETAGGT